jgi:hypothetical protein
MNWNSGNLPEAWKKFKQHAELMFSGPLKEKGEQEKISYLLIWVGETGRDIFNTFPEMSAENAKLLASYWEKFHDHVTPRSNEVYERYKFHNRVQTPADTFDTFVTDLKLLVKDCGYDNPEQMVRDRLVFGVSSHKIREKLIHEGSGLTLPKAIDIAHTCELSQSQLKSMSGDTAIKHVQRSESRPYFDSCYFCGQGHYKGKCPAFNSTCGKCKRKHHFTSQCETVSRKYKPRSGSRPRTQGRGQGHPRRPRSQSPKAKGRNRMPRGKRNVHKVEHSVDDDDGIQIQMIDIHSQKEKKKLVAKLRVKNMDATLTTEVDTGAGANVMPVRCFKQLYPKYMSSDGKPDQSCPHLKPQLFSNLRTYIGEIIPQYGTITLKCSVGSKTRDIQFYICETNGPILLGREDSIKLELITISEHVKHISISVVSTQKKEKIEKTEDLIREYPDRFQGLGKFQQKARIVLKDDAQPVVAAPRRCPINIRTEIQDSLDDMEKNGIISKIPTGQPTEWLSSLAYARKSNGKLRVCLDPRDLNLNIKRTYHRAPTVEEITHKLADAKVFSKLDAKNGYWHIELEEESSLLTAFNSPASNQRYKFNRLAFGLKVAQDFFQEAMDTITRDLRGVIAIADDPVVFGVDDEDHEANLRAFMEAARKHGLILNKEKCFIKVPEISFFGSTYGPNGVRPDAKRVEEITGLDSPTTLKELQSFMGMVQYLSPFIPHLSDLTAPLRGLYKVEEFTWTQSHETAFKAIKDAISKDTTLRYYNPKFKTKLQVDASQKGLGAALIQMDPSEPEKERIIAFASKSLTDTETRYANIEREFLAVVFGVEKFHTYIYGTNVLVETDHKPLEAIHLKSLTQAPPRLQRMMLRLQQYDLEIKYRKGKELLLADFLSRYKPNPKEKEIALDKTIHAVHWSETKLHQLREETKKDPTLDALAEVIRSGWPAKASDLRPTLRPYWSLKDYLCMDDGILLKGHQVVVPPVMRKDILSQLHNTAHQGIEKTRLLSRKCVYWPNINTDIAEEVGGCLTCNTHSNSLPSEPMYERELPSSPWEILGTDLFQFKGRTYIIVADYFSKFFIIKKLSSETTECVIGHMKNIFSEHGIPNLVYSDNGPCYSSAEFKLFTQAYGFQHITSSPRYPQSNGYVERMIQVVKNTMKKCADTKQDLQLALLSLRTTPISGTLPSPAELLNSRQMKSTLPLVSKHSSKDELSTEELKKRQNTQKVYYDRGTRELPPLKSGQTVMVQDLPNLRWKPGTVVSPTKEPRSYIVQDTNGARYWRNRKYIRQLPPQCNLPEEPSEDLTPDPNQGTSSATPTNTLLGNSQPKESPVNPKRNVTFNDQPPGPTTTTPRRSVREHKPPPRLICEM